jgi:excisionase family DNA binding protein
MNDAKALTLEELQAEHAKIAGLIRIAKEARIRSLQKELDELLSDPASPEADRPRPQRAAREVAVLSVPKRLYTLREAAQSLGMSTGTVRRLVQRGLLKPNRSLRTLMFPVAELDRFASQTE